MGLPTDSEPHQPKSYRFHNGSANLVCNLHHLPAHPVHIRFESIHGGIFCPYSKYLIFSNLKRHSKTFLTSIWTDLNIFAFTETVTVCELLLWVVAQKTSLLCLWKSHYLSVRADISSNYKWWNTEAEFFFKSHEGFLSSTINVYWNYGKMQLEGKSASRVFCYLGSQYDRSISKWCVICFSLFLSPVVFSNVKLLLMKTEAG